MRAKTLLAIIKLGDLAQPVWLADNRLVIHGDGYAVRYTATERLMSGAAYVSAPWLRDVLAASEKEASLEALRDRTIKAQLGNGACLTSLAADDGLAFPSLPRWRARTLSRDELSVADFAKSGPVAHAADSASKDRKRALMHGVYLDGYASGSDGHALARRALKAPLGSGAFVPLPMARAVMALVAATRTEQFVLRRSPENDRAWFVGRTAEGALWSIVGNLGHVDEMPAYVDAATFPVDRSVIVDAGDVRSLVRSYGAATPPHLAIMPCGGLVAWDSAEQIGSTVERYSASEPVFTFGPQTTKSLAKALPKVGKITIDVGRHESGSFCARIGERVIAGIRGGDLLPDGVRRELAMAFGVTSDLRTQAVEVAA